MNSTTELYTDTLHCLMVQNTFVQANVPMATHLISLPVYNLFIYITEDFVLLFSNEDVT